MIATSAAVTPQNQKKEKSGGQPKFPGFVVGSM
jgi:hypothetical protein